MLCHASGMAVSSDSDSEVGLYDFWTTPFGHKGIWETAVWAKDDWTKDAWVTD